MAGEHDQEKELFWRVELLCDTIVLMGGFLQ